MIVSKQNLSTVKKLTPLQKLAAIAVRHELEDYKWANLDVLTARKIHGMLPRDL